MQIREDIAEHMSWLKAWLRDTEDAPLEEMGGFFSARLQGYEEHMSVWSEAYRHMATLVPEGVSELLDIGCGTGLELDELLKLRPKLSVTGIDMSKDMLSKLSAKHPQVKLVCADYLEYQPPLESFEAAISFETLHHLYPVDKARLFRSVWGALKPGGEYIEADYIACSAEEETLLFEVYERKRKRDKVPDGLHVHFDTPLTLEHELALMRGAGFSIVEPVCSIAGACFIRATKQGERYI